MVSEEPRRCCEEAAAALPPLSTFEIIRLEVEDVKGGIWENNPSGSELKNGNVGVTTAMLTTLNLSNNVHSTNTVRWY
jgi:hypothetical protein